MPRPKPNYGTKHLRLFVYNCIFLNCSSYRDSCFKKIREKYLRIFLIRQNYALVAIGTFHGSNYIFHRYAKPGYRYCKNEWCFRELGLVGLSYNRPANRLCLCQALEKI